MRNRTKMQEIGTTVEVAGVERDVTLVYALYPGEKADRWSPGCLPEAELRRATFDDDGSEMPEGLISDEDIRELGNASMELRADEDEARREDAEIARAERRREILAERGH